MYRSPKRRAKYNVGTPTPPAASTTSPYGANAFGDPNYQSPLYQSLSGRPTTPVVPMTTMSPGVPTTTMSGNPSTLPMAKTMTIDPAYDPGATTTTSTAPFSLTPKQATIGAAPGVIGGLYGGVRSLVERSKLKKQDLTPLAVKEGAADAQLRANSGQVSNFGQQSDLITQSENDAINNAAKFSTSATQALSMIPRIQRGSNRSRFNLGEAGRQQQNQNINRLDRYRNMEAEYETMANNRYADQYAAYTNSANQNFMNAGTTAAQFALMV